MKEEELSRKCVVVRIHGSQALRDRGDRRAPISFLCDLPESISGILRRAGELTQDGKCLGFYPEVDGEESRTHHDPNVCRQWLVGRRELEL